MNRIKSGFLCIGLLLALTACGGSGAGTTPTSPVVTATLSTTTAPILTPAPTLAPTSVPPSTPAPAMPTSLPLLSPNDPLELGTEKPAAIADARAGINDIALLFVPIATEEGMTAFQDSPTGLPKITTQYEPQTGALFVTLHNVLLSSGTLQAGQEDWVYDYANEYGLVYPYEMTMGSIGKDSRFFTNAAISSNGVDSIVSMVLTEAVTGYRVEPTALTDSMFPLLRIVFS